MALDDRTRESLRKHAAMPGAVYPFAFGYTGSAAATALAALEQGDTERAKRSLQDIAELVSEIDWLDLESDHHNRRPNYPRI